jgi:hypothetical protein
MIDAQPDLAAHRRPMAMEQIPDVVDTARQRILDGRHGRFSAGLTYGSKEIVEGPAREDIDLPTIEILPSGQLAVAAQLALNGDRRRGVAHRRPRCMEGCFMYLTGSVEGDGR